MKENANTQRNIERKCGIRQKHSKRRSVEKERQISYEEKNGEFC